jgi:hypothetical protein
MPLPTSLEGWRLLRQLVFRVKFISTIILALNKISVKSKGKPKILEKLVNGYENFLQAQRTLHLEFSPELGLDNKKIILAQKKTIVKVEQQTLPLIITFFNENFGPFGDLSQDIKVCRLKSVIYF